MSYLTASEQSQLRWQQENIDWFRQHAPELLGEDDYMEPWDWRMPKEPEADFAPVQRRHTWAEKGKGPSDEELQLLKQEEEEERRESGGFGVVPVVRTQDDVSAKIRQDSEMFRKMWSYASPCTQTLLQRCNPFKIHQDMMDVDRTVPQSESVRIEELDTHPLPLVCDKENTVPGFCLPDAAYQEADVPDDADFEWTEEDERQTQRLETLAGYRAMDDEIFAKVLAVRDELSVGFEISDQEIADAILDNDGSVQAAACWITFRFRPKSQGPNSSPPPPVKPRPPVWNTRPDDDFEKLYWL